MRSGHIFQTGKETVEWQEAKMQCDIHSEGKLEETHGVTDRLGGAKTGYIRKLGGFLICEKLGGISTFSIIWRSPGAAGTESKAPR